MKHFYCYIIDDNAEDIEIIKTFVKRIPNLILAGYAVDPLKGLRELRKLSAVTILFLDVQMEPLSGLDILPQLDPHIQVVLCTSHKRFAWDAYEDWPIDYLLKPFSFTRFIQVVKSAEAKSHYTPSIRAHNMDYSYFFVPAGTLGWMEKIDFDELLHIAADGECSTFHMDDGRQLSIGTRLSKIYKALPKNQFIRVHRSHVINIKEVRGIRNGKVLLKDAAATEIPIGPTFAEEIYSWRDDYRMG